MASRRMRLKGVANVATVNRAAGGGSANSGGRITPSPSPGFASSEHSQHSNSSFPYSPRSPMKNFHPVASPTAATASGRSRHASTSSSPRRPEPSASPYGSGSSPWSPIPTASSSSALPITSINVQPQQSTHSQELASMSPYFQPIEFSNSNSAVMSGKQHSNSSVNTDSENSHSLDENRRYFSFPSVESSQHAPTEGDNVNESQVEGSSSTGNNYETLRQRLQKGTLLSTSKYATVRKEFLTQYQNIEKQPDKNKLTILHFTFWNPPKNEGDNNNDKDPAMSSDEMSTNNTSFYPYQEGRFTSQSQKQEDSEAGTTNATLDERDQKNIPRVKVGPNGEVVVDEQSLVIETSDSKRAKKQLEEMETVSGTGFEVGSSGVFRHKRNSNRGRDWNEKETIRFYRALNNCGTDFSMMSQFFPNRSRTELKAKFKREDRKNPHQISKALRYQTFNPEDHVSSDEDPSTKNQDLYELPITKPHVEEQDSEKSKTKENENPADQITQALGLGVSIFEGTETVPLSRPPKPVKKIKAQKEMANQTRTSKKGKLIMTEKKMKPTESQLQKGKYNQTTSKKKNARKKEKSAKKTDNAESDLRPEILKFDPGDPLGRKVVAPNSSQPSPTLILDAPNCETSAHQVFDLSKLLRQGTNSGVSKDAPIVQRPMKKRNPYRVPGPGTLPPSKSQDMADVDEIEIEISCQ